MFSFKEFLSTHASTLDLSIPDDIIEGKIWEINYKNNPIQITIKTKDGKKITLDFHNRYIYDKKIKSQNPKIGSGILLHLKFGKMSNFQVLGN